MSFTAMLLAELFGCLLLGALCTSTIEMVVLMIRAPKKLYDE
jgi:hypothetical protein